MPKLKVHYAISKERTGKSYEKLHNWIDDNKDDCGVNHRSKNHAYIEETRDCVYKNFGGGEAVSEWLFHIVLDSLDTYHKNQRDFTRDDRNFMKFGFAKNGFIFFEDAFIDDGKNESVWLEEFEDYTPDELGELLSGISEAIFGKEEDKPGYCIRCKKEIPYNEKRPYCLSCYESWKKFGNKGYREKYCHDCGKPCKSALAEPLCKECEEES
ncbi:MAG: hypothetical protein NTY83_02140 [Candidatus Micrarchaeota archaeon]|nr:hypothetical protein [Candidatus Micrarchaeota archaeon]